MKICFMIDELAVRGGTHKQLLRLCEEIRDQNIDFEIVTKYYNSELTYPEFNGFQIRSLYSTNTTKSNVITRFFDGIKMVKLISKDCTIINYHDSGLSVPIIIFKLMHNKKLIWQMNDLPYFFLEGQGNNLEDNWKRKIQRFVFRSIVRSIDEITVNVTKNAKRIEKFMGRNAKVFYCGVDKINDSLSTHTSIIDKQRINLLSTGVFFPYRNYETLVEVVRNLRNNGVPVRLNIIGSTKLDPDYYLSVDRKIKESNLEDSIRIHGQVDEKTFSELYNKSDIFLFINRDQSWGLAVFEAMSVGLPTIVSNSVGAVELLTDRFNAVIVNPLSVEEISNEIVRLVEDEKLYKDYSINGMTLTKQLTWSNTYCKDMIELFQKYSD